MIDAANTIAIAWWGWMGPMLWQVSLLIVIVSVIDMLVGKWIWPQVRYAVWLMVLLKLLIPPTWALPVSIVSRSLPWVQERIVRTLDGEPASPADLPAVPESIPALEPTRSIDGGEPAGSTVARIDAAADEIQPVWQVYAMGVWSLGMALFLGLLVARTARLRRWHREHDEQRTIPVWFHELLVGTARRLKLERLPAIVFSDEAVAPAVYGVFRPVLLLPAGYADSISREDAEHVLLHELAHLKRGDLWLHGLLLLLQTIYWFNPLLIWVRKQTKHVREICCDLTIANVLREKTKAYRQTLLDTARKLLTESLEPGMGLLGVFEEPFRLVARLRWLERESWRTRRWAVVAGCGVVLVMTPLVLPMAAVEPSPASAAAASSIDGSAPMLSGQGDVYVRETAHRDSYLLFFRTRSELLYESVTWIGDRRMAIEEPGARRILDLDRNVFYVVNHAEESYVEMPLPLDMSRHLSEPLARERRHHLNSIAVEKTDRSRTVLDYRCDEYLLTYWEVNDGVRSHYSKAKVWAAPDVPFDLTVFYELLRNTRRTLPWDDAALQELKKIDGFQMAYERGTGSTLIDKRFVTRIVEMTRKNPPADVYSVPSHYTRKTRFTDDDF